MYQKASRHTIGKDESNDSFVDLPRPAEMSTHQSTHARDHYKKKYLLPSPLQQKDERIVHEIIQQTAIGNSQSFKMNKNLILPTPRQRRFADHYLWEYTERDTTTSISSIY